MPGGVGAASAIFGVGAASAIFGVGAASAIFSKPYCLLSCPKLAVPSVAHARRRGSRLRYLQ
jgi:hypothetical protein